jgi:hypothetical protein
MNSPRQQPSVGDLAPPVVGPHSTRRHPRLQSLLFAAIFFLGFVVGIGAVLFYTLSIANQGQLVTSQTSSGNGAITVQVSASYIAQLVEKTLGSSGIPGSVTNVRVTLAQKNSITVTGDDQLAVMGIGVTRHFSLQLQAFVHSCQLQMHVLHADLGGIPLTGFVVLFESQINKQLQFDPSSFPKGFTYCVTDVRTRPQELLITYSAKPE